MQREEIGRIFCPHFLDPLARRAEGFHARHNHARGNGYSVNFVSYGSAVEIDPGALSRFFLLQIPLKGQALVRCGTMLTEAEAGTRASLLSPTLPTRMTWSEGCEKLILLIDRAVMEAYGMTKKVNGKKTWLSESETVEKLFSLYEKLAKK